MVELGADRLAVDPLAAAHLLLGSVLTCRGVTATVVEVEAYGGGPHGRWSDPAAHSYRGPTGRNAVMFGPPGQLYTYLSHGMHVCANVSCGPAGEAAAVLLRAAKITDGIDAAHRRRRAGAAPASLARGPGNLCAALGITMADNGSDLFDPASPVRVALAVAAAPTAAGPRVGVSRAADRRWRLWSTGHSEVSAYRRSPRAPAPGTDR